MSQFRSATALVNGDNTKAVIPVDMGKGLTFCLITLIFNGIVAVSGFLNRPGWGQLLLTLAFSAFPRKG